MTGYTVHTGASKKFVSGWDKVFGSQPSAAKSKKSDAHSPATSSESASEKKTPSTGKSKPTRR